MTSQQQKRREAREQRKLAELQATDKKSARFKERPDMVAAVRFVSEPATKKTIRFGANPGSIFQMTMAWSATDADVDGAWSWGALRQWTDDEWKGSILPKLQEWENLKWAEIESHTTGNRERHRLHHLMERLSLCSESQKRLEHLGSAQTEKHEKDPAAAERLVIPYDDDEIFRFRLGGRPRLWGYRIVNVFHVVWYDSQHGVYPTDVE